MKTRLLLILFCFPLVASAITPAELDRLIPALIQVESGGNPLALGDYQQGLPQAVGVLQIWTVMVDDVNRIAGTNYRPVDRLDRAKSIEMCRIYFNHYGKKWTMEQAARHWNSGPNKITGTDKYWNKVRKELK
jgi:hypothetical protein